MPAAPIPTLRTIDLAAAQDTLASVDPTLGDLMARVGPFRLQPGYRLTPYQRLFSAIIYQQVSTAAATTILGRVQALFGNGRSVPDPEAFLAMPDEPLRGAGLSRGKLRAIRDLARRAAAGELPDLRTARRLDDEILIERLVQVRGVGRWTAEMLLIGGLGRTDVLPATDLGIQKGFQIAFRTRQLPSPERLHQAGRKWRPWRTIAAWYLWRATDSL